MRLLILFFTLIIYSCSPSSMPSGDESSFDKKEWDASSESTDQYMNRYEMLEDLKTNYLKIGTKKNEILQLLGPIDKGYVPVFNEDKNMLYYPVGTTGFDPCTLYLYFNEKYELMKLEVDCS